MRAIDKGAAPRQYSQYNDAKRDLIDRTGPFCAYCELPIRDLGYIDHVHPQSKGGAASDWDNFLLSCFFCNLVKSDRNLGRDGYLWPDRDNTDLAFGYAQEFAVRPASSLNEEQRAAAQKLIDLAGLDRTAASSTRQDMRWRSRNEAWKKAQEMYEAWQKRENQRGLLKAIPMIAHATGYYSIWATVFAQEPRLLAAMQSRFPNTYNQVDEAGNRIRRPGAII
jgi:hypothetical protein